MRKRKIEPDFRNRLISNVMLCNLFLTHHMTQLALAEPDLSHFISLIKIFYELCFIKFYDEFPEEFI